MGRQVLQIDGRSAAGRERYGTHEVAVTIERGKTNELGHTTWMSALDRSGDIKIKNPTRRARVLKTPRIPGLEIKLPSGSRIRGADGRPVRKLNVTAVPTDRPPFPLPPYLHAPVYFTAQPGGAYLSKGAQITYPNYLRLPAGERVKFWNYDPDDRGWYVYGRGTVTRNRKQVVPDKDVRIWEFSGAMAIGTATPPAKGPHPGGGGDGADPVDLRTGLFVYEKTDLALSDSIPALVKRTYRQEITTAMRSGEVPHSLYDMRLWTDSGTYQDGNLILPDGGRVPFVRTSPGTSRDGAVLEANTTPGQFFGAKLSYTGPTSYNNWSLRLRDGTVYSFDSGRASLRGIQDKYGNKLTITRDPDGTGGDGSVTRLTTAHGKWVKFTYDSARRITRARDNGGRTTSYTYDGSGRLATATDAKAA